MSQITTSLYRRGCEYESEVCVEALASSRYGQSRVCVLPLVLHLFL